MVMNKFMGALIIFCTLLSCNSDVERIEMKNLNGIWNKTNEQNFDFQITRPQEAKNIIFVVRNNNKYPYSNLRLIVSFLDLKTKKKSIDTLNYTLAKPNGEWLGKGFGETKEILFQYKMDYHFPQAGRYQIGVIQAMRRDILPGIEDFGVKIETAQNTDKNNGK